MERPNEHIDLLVVLALVTVPTEDSDPQLRSILDRLDCSDAESAADEKELIRRWGRALMTAAPQETKRPVS